MSHDYSQNHYGDSEVDNLKRQLAAAQANSQKREANAIAACKLKDEALEMCKPLAAYGIVGSRDVDQAIFQIAISKALTIQPDDSALKAWLGDPAGWVWERRYNNGGYSREVFQFESEALEMAEDGKNLPRQDTVTPLYSPKGLK